jgi:hypothetical protein
LGKRINLAIPTENYVGVVVVERFMILTALNPYKMVFAGLAAREFTLTLLKITLKKGIRKGLKTK